MKSSLPSLRVLRQFLFVPSVLKSSAMAEREKLNKITEAIIGAAIQVHRALGPGLLESAYVACLAYELKKRGLVVEEQRAVPLVYEEVKLECGYRMDLLVEKSVVVEVKSIEALAPIHEAQTLSYLRLSGCKLALLINFNVTLLKDGIRLSMGPSEGVSLRCLPSARRRIAPASQAAFLPSGREIHE